VHVLDPESGRLAGGDVGAGRLASPENIVSAAERILSVDGDLAGVSVVVTAGGTREPIDAVRVIANRSSGKQGYAIAAEAVSRGADVTLVTTVELPLPTGVRAVCVETAAQMKAAVDAASRTADVVVMCAAVADFRPVAAADGKIKKRDGVPEIVLEPTPDILAALGAAKRPGQVLVGFAAETNDVEANAREKLARKNLDMVVANDVSAPGVGFQHDTNSVTIYLSTGHEKLVPLASKRTVARHLLDSVVEIRQQV